MIEELFVDENLPQGYRSGFVAVVGRPNVGKSTLMNYYLGQKIAIVSAKPQTTRNQLLGILTLPTEEFPDLNAQVVFVDTPGIHNPHHKLGEYLVEEAQSAMPDSDVIVWLVDSTRPPGREEEMVVGAIQAARKKEPDIPVLLAMNKIDLLSGNPDARSEAMQPFLALFPDVTARFSVSATQAEACDVLLREIVSQLPLGPMLFPEDQVTDQQVRFLAAELIREAALNILREEVPHSLAVVVTEFKQRHEKLTYISANLVLERKSQKQIVIGEHGRTLKHIGSQARPQIEALIETRVYLDLWVKVRPGWRKKKNELKWLGYSLPD
jgi:GTP-binding protein Era